MSAAEQDRRVDMVGGYRLVRKLGSGERGEVFLGHASHEETPTEASTVAVKLFRTSTSERSIGDEIGVLAGTSSPHLLRLIDVATAPDGRPCAILPRLSSTSLARLLADRSSLGAGEAVTILAPLCSAVAGLHLSRVCHGAIRPGSILFDQRGAPVLARFGRASSFGNDRGHEGCGAATLAELTAEPRVGADLSDLAALVELVLSRVTSGASASSVSALLDLARMSGPQPVASRFSTGHFAEGLAERMFELAPAAPVDFAHPIAASLGRLPARMVTAEPIGEMHPQTERASSRRPAAGAAARLFGRMAAALPYVSISAEHLARLKAALASIRRPFWIAGAAGAVAIVVALSLVQMTGATDAASGSASSVHAGAEASPQTDVAAPSPPVAGSAARSKAPGVGGASSGKDAIVADDPVAAGEALLRNRERCIQKRSVLCLDSVDQVNSSALDDDSYLIHSLRDGGAVGEGKPLSGAKVVLSERLGDSALLAVQGEGSTNAGGAGLLIVKGESGWRIRDFLAN